jgi:mono/diheme cytochrome c family protein
MGAMKSFDLHFALALSAALALPAVAGAEAPIRGDAVRGEQIFRMECSACHGADARGASDWKALSEQKGLGKIPDLRDAAYLVQRSDAQLRTAIRKGDGRNGTIPGHAFGKALSSLETWDLVQYLRNGVLTVTDLYPEASKFTAKDFTIDAPGQARLKDGAGIALAPGEATVVVLTVYGGPKDESGNVRLVPWKPVNLDLLKADERLGFLVFDEVLLPGETQKTELGLAIGRDGKIKKIVLNLADPKRRAEHEKVLAGFVGQGERKPTKLKAPKGVKNADKYEAVITRTLGRAAEGIAMYDKSERDRTMFD